MTRAARNVVVAIDLFIATAVLVAATFDLVGQRLTRGRSARMPGRGLLVLDAAYSLDTLRRRGQEHSLLSRDLEGWFDRVWHVHPLVGADDREASASTHGRPVTVSLAPGHEVVEGHPSLTAHPRFELAEFALAQWFLLRSLHSVLRAGRVQVIRAGDPYYLGLLGLALAWAHRLPLVLRINGNYDQIYDTVGRLAYPRLFRRRWVEKRVDRFVLRRADLVAGANRDNLGFALRNGTPPERGVVFPYGALIDPVHRGDPGSRRDVRPELGVDGRRLLIAVTRLEPVKHSGDVLRVLAMLRARHPDLAAVLVGEGSELEQLQSLAVELQVSEHVVFAGSKDQAWIADALASSIAYVAPSAGRALVEGALAGLPLVAYEVDWHAELVCDGVTGLLVPFGDVTAMATALDSLLNDPTLASRLGKGARAMAGEAMDPSALIALERQAFERLLVTCDARGGGPG